MLKVKNENNLISPIQFGFKPEEPCIINQLIPAVHEIFESLGVGLERGEGGWSFPVNIMKRFVWLVYGNSCFFRVGIWYKKSLEYAVLPLFFLWHSEIHLNLSWSGISKI